VLLRRLLALPFVHFGPLPLAELELLLGDHNTILSATVDNRKRPEQDLLADRSQFTELSFIAYTRLGVPHMREYG
jgi:hypothetical protein